ncbi:flagellar hook-length control protein FliK [Marinobacterium aestuariivivens]|uniref:Flagellar hook-length control protein FliK n=1 Tax=Marinobacterium aestuariivivens TaxID=1698799 RepID=A0ABW1ZX32_9GAMM
MAYQAALRSRGTGQPRCRTAPGDDARVSARFWAAEADTARRVQQRLDSLGTDLGRQGLQVETLSCHQGSAPAPKPASTAS